MCVFAPRCSTSVRLVLAGPRHSRFLLPHPSSAPQNGNSKRKFSLTVSSQGVFGASNAVGDTVRSKAAELGLQVASQPWVYHSWANAAVTHLSQARLESLMVGLQQEVDRCCCHHAGMCVVCGVIEAEQGCGSGRRARGRRARGCCCRRNAFGQASSASVRFYRFSASRFTPHVACDRCVHALNYSVTTSSPCCCSLSFTGRSRARSHAAAARVWAAASLSTQLIYRGCCQDSGASLKGNVSPLFPKTSIAQTTFLRIKATDTHMLCPARCGSS
jgi:hypothetical protein